MDIKRFTNFWVLILVSIATLTVFLPNGIAQDYTQKKEINTPLQTSFLYLK